MPSSDHEVTVLIDSRERTPLLFPSWIDLHEDRTLDTKTIQVKTKKMALPAGDYTIEGHDECCIIETKRSLRELYTNVCTDDWSRVARALKRLSDGCQYPILVWEVSPSELFRKSLFVQDPLLVFDRWIQAVVRFNLRLMLVGGSRQPGSRRKLGEQLLRLMLTYIHQPPPTPEPWSPSLRELMWKWAPEWISKQ